MTRLYKYRITRWPTRIDMDDWADFAEERWGDRDKPFFLPDEEKVFRSRSSAKARVDIVRSWGGDAEVLECEPVWVECGLAAAKRKQERDQKRADRLREKAYEIESQYIVIPF